MCSKEIDEKKRERLLSFNHPSRSRFGVELTLAKQNKTNKKKGSKTSL
jgi:hypothetical protein